jgi:hypothetical protein
MGRERQVVGPVSRDRQMDGSKSRVDDSTRRGLSGSTGRRYEFDSGAARAGQSSRDPSRYSAATGRRGGELHSRRSGRTRRDLCAAIRSRGRIRPAIYAVCRAGGKFWDRFRRGSLAELRLRLAAS